jgi:monoamine oxidase
VAVCGVTADLLAESEGGAQTKRFVGGTSKIPLGLAAALGDRIVLNSPVLTIDYSDDRVTVTCRGGLTATGRQVVVALAPTLAGRIMYDPPMPGVRDQLTQRMPQASAHKMFVLYDEPFWRAEGLNAQLISEVGPARMSNDSCMPDETGGPGIILAFLEGESARVAGRWPTGQRAEALRAELGLHFGPRASRGADCRGWLGRPPVDPRLATTPTAGPCGLIHLEALNRPIGPPSSAGLSGCHGGCRGRGHRAASRGPFSPNRT